MTTVECYRVSRELDSTTSLNLFIFRTGVSLNLINALLQEFLTLKRHPKPNPLPFCPWIHQPRCI